MTSDTQEYQLRPDVNRVVRAGLVLAGDETIVLDVDEAAQHDDVLDPVDDDDQDSTSDGSDSASASAITTSSDSTEDTA